MPKADLILAVPLHRRRAWRRGFNQSDLIARDISRTLNIPYASRALSRIRPTVTQRLLSARERRRNLRNAFALEMPVKDRHIVLIDDVVTTGGTVGEIARLLLRHQAATVQIWCLCRTL